ncbi:MAG: nucleotidyltransferase substrate binding protein [Colwellia sp.]|nr:nucleotidyltransferase substrate binding protein [Colwellia sp.]
MIVLTPFKKALLSLEKALQQPKNEFIRDSVIQRFEYTYELAWKFLRRFLVADVGSETLAPLTRKDLFRLAADKKIIIDPLPWFEYHQARNTTSHTYDEVVAEQVYQSAKNFFDDAQLLYKELERRND